MKRFLPVICGVVIAGSAAPCWGRSWTNSEGKAIEAEYVSHADGKVLLKMNGREISYEIAKLSSEDQEYLENLAAPAAPEKIVTGFSPGNPITERLFPELDDYYDDRDRKSNRKSIESGSMDSQEMYKIGTFDEWIKRDPARDTYQAYVPASYDGSEAYGLVLYISPNSPTQIPSEWGPVLDSLKLIAVAPEYVNNETHMPRRVQVSMDTLATAEKRYKIDPARRVVTGLSGGGHMAMVTAALYPDYFIGAISHAAQSYLPYSAGGNYDGHFPGLTLEDFTGKKRKHMRWLVVSGDKDYNYKAIQETSEKWTEAKLAYRFLDVPGMGHETAKADQFKEALLWVGLKEVP